MRRFIVGGLLAVIGCLIGTKFSQWYAPWWGLSFGFIAGLIFEDLKVTKRVLTETVKKVQSHEYDWLGSIYGCLFIVCACLGILSWIEFVVFTGVGSDEKLVWDLRVICHIFICLIIVICVIIQIFTVIIGGVTLLKDEYDNKKQQRELLREMFMITFFVSAMGLPLLAIWALFFKAIPYLRKVLPRTPDFISRTIKFVWYSLIDLMAREKTLTFAICVTAGIALGMLRHDPWWAAPSISALTAMGLIALSDRLREVAKQKLEELKAQQAVV